MTITPPPYPHRTTPVALLAGPAVAAVAEQPGALPSCRERHVSISAAAFTTRGHAMVVTVTNRAGEPCLLGRPTVTFGDLEDAAGPVPWGSDGPFRLEPGQRAHAAVRTAADGSGDAKIVHYVTVAAAPAHHGTRFSVAEIGFGELGLYVCDPVTTSWHPTLATAQETLFELVL